MTSTGAALGAGLFLGSAVLCCAAQASHGRIEDAQSVTVSCPGKILMAGGYLVLEAPNVGLTISSSSRFFTEVACCKDRHQVTSTIIVVESPQFHESYVYSYDSISDKLEQISTESNGFVEKCLVMTLRFISRHLGLALQRRMSGLRASQRGLCITLRAHNDFYSQISRLLQQGKPLLSSSLQQLPEFIDCPVDKTGVVEVSKTGLGSSAALVTSMVGALLEFFGVVHLRETGASDSRWIVHNLAQLVHSHAQGKIGSGFDVSAAVYGSQIYQRFDQSSFLPCLEPHVAADTLHGAVMDRSLWTQQAEEFHLPASMDLVLGDVCGGTASASMARAVLDFRKRSPQIADKLWGSIADTNLKLSKLVRKIASDAKANATQFELAAGWASETCAEEWAARASESDLCSDLCSARNLFQQARRLLKELGIGAGVEIEPDAQTELLDATLRLPGVIAGGVPGAGGHDAVFVLVLGAAARARVEQLWSTWASESRSSSSYRPQVCPLILHAGERSGAGIRVEPSL